MEIDYVKNAAEILAKMGVEYSVRRVGNACPPFCKDRADIREAGVFPRKTHIHGDQHACFLSRNGEVISFNFWDSYQEAMISDWWASGGRKDWWGAPWASRKLGEHENRERGIAWIKAHRDVLAPTSYSLLACLQKSELGTFEDFCMDFGYSDDSIRALETYSATQVEWNKLRGFFSSAELEVLQGIS